MLRGRWRQRTHARRLSEGAISSRGGRSSSVHRTPTGRLRGAGVQSLAAHAAIDNRQSPIDNPDVVLWNPAYKPRLRPLEAVPVAAEDGDGVRIAVRDRCHLSDVTLTVSQPAFHVLTLMDGENSCAEIRRLFEAAYRQALAVNTLQSMLDHLEGAHLLEGEAFDVYYESLLGSYRASGRRPMPHAEALGIDSGGRGFDEMISGASPSRFARPIQGLIAPHLDYPRGEPCYVAAYGALREGPAPDRVIVLGTNHFGRSMSVVATGCDFETPLGTTRTDRAFLERIEGRCGDLRRYELDHAREHSVELQVGWLQHLFGADRFKLVPFLCPDPCGPTGTAPFDGDGVDLRTFAIALGELIRLEDETTTLVVAGADLSHVGAAFGDERALDEAFLAEVSRRDRAALDLLAAGDSTGFVGAVATDENVTRVCSAGCIFALATALPDARGQLLGYHQAVDQPSQTCVTCAAVAFV